MDSCKVRSLFLFHPQVASARLRGLIERPQFIGSSIETLLFGNFFYLVRQKKHSCIFLVLYCIVYFSLLNLCPRGERGFAPTLDPLQSFGCEGLASHCFCFGSCCSDNTGSAGSQGLSADIQSLFRGQNPSSSGKGHETF